MKQFKKTAAILIALFSMGLLGAGCGGSGDTGPAGPAGQGSVTSTTVYQPQAGGPATIYFTASNIYNSGVALSAGQLLTQANYFVDPFLNASWLFANNVRQGGSGTISIYNGSLGYQGGQAVLSGTSGLDSGNRLTLAVQTGSDIYHQNVVYGQLDISGNYVQRVFSGGVVPQVIGLTIDVGVYGNNTLTSGGILIYTSQDQNGYHGVFLRF